MPQVFTDNTGNRVIVRHKGPAGVGIPVGGTTGQILVKDSADPYDTHWANPPNGTDAVVGPASATNNCFPLFDGTTGKLIKNSTYNAAFFGSRSLVDTKEDKVVGKGLSEEDFTTVEKAKLTALSEATFRGVFTGLLTGVGANPIADFTFDPAPKPGDYCVIEVSGDPLLLVVWDETNTDWTLIAPEALAMTGNEIAGVLFAAVDSVTWDINECRIFTGLEKAQLANHQAVLSALGVTGAIPAYAALSYFSVAGTTGSVITATSDGLTNMVKIDTPTALGGVSSGFDNGGSSNCRLRYTGATTRNFSVTATVSLNAAAAETFVLGLAKNATIDQPSRVLVTPTSTGELSTVTLTAIVALSLNDYLELFIGNIDTTTDPTVFVTSIEAHAI